MRILPDPCPCGSHLPAIEVMGRTNDILYLPTDNNDTARVMPLPMIAAFLGIRDLQNYRVLQTANDEIRVEYVPDRGADLEHLKSQIARAVEARIQAERGAVGRIKFDYKVVDDIERDRYSGKIKQVQRLIDP